MDDDTQVDDTQVDDMPHLCGDTQVDDEVAAAGDDDVPLMTMMNELGLKVDDEVDAALEGAGGKKEKPYVIHNGV